MERSQLNKTRRPPLGARGWTERTLRSKGITGMDRTLTLMTPWLYGNGASKPERTRPPLGRRGNDRTNPNEPVPHGPREWIERPRRNPGRMEMYRTHPNEPDDPRAHGNGSEAHERNRRSPWRTHGNGPNAPEPTPWRTGMGRTLPNEPDHHQGAREWTERTRTNTKGARECTTTNP